MPAVVCAAVSIACGSTPSSPSPARETFSGTLTARSKATHTFSTASSANATITLTELAPSVAVGLGIGTFASNACAVAAADDSVTKGELLQINLVQGNYCVEIYDVGNVTGSLTYIVTVEHR